MKRPSYRDAIYWIALNDGPGDLDALYVEYVKELITVRLVADLFGQSDERVARDVVTVRREEG